MTEVTKEARGLATVGRKGGLATAAMDGRSVATKVAMLAFMTEGHEEAAQRWVAKEAFATAGREEACDEGRDGGAQRRQMRRQRTVHQRRAMRG